MERESLGNFGLILKSLTYLALVALVIHVGIFHNKK